MTRVLVTGATGFIGRHLTEALLARGFTVRALVRSEATIERVELAHGDIRDASALRAAVADCDAVIHLAARVHAVSSLADDPEQDAVTLEGTRLLLDAALQAGVKRFVFLSTVAVYRPSNEAQDEDSPVAPETSYGRAKLAAERMLLAVADRIEVVILRPVMVYGPGCKGNLPRFIRAIARPLFAIPGGTDNRRSLLHVDNLVQAIVLATTHPKAAGRTYVVTDARDVSTREMAQLIARALGRRLPIVRIPRVALQLGAFAGDLGGKLLRRRLPFDSATLTKLTESQYFRSDRLTRELGYAPRREFAESIEETVRHTSRHSATS